MTLLNGAASYAARVEAGDRVQPSVRAGAGHGIRCARGNRGGITRMQTSEPNVLRHLASCCEIDGQTFGLVAPCLAQRNPGRAAGRGTLPAPFTLTDSGMRLKGDRAWSCSALGRAAEQ